MLCRAISFVRRSEAGRSKPPLVIAEMPDGSAIDVWIKAPGLHATISQAAPAREWMAARVAEVLNIPCAQPVCVALSPEFIDAIPSNGLAECLRSGPNVVFGSRHLGTGWRRWNEAASLPRSEHQSQAEAYLFDTIIQNWDRRIANPNILRKGDRYRLIDHEEAFVSATGPQEDRSVVRLPWQVGGINNYSMGDYQHPFWRSIKTSKRVDLSQAAAAWKSLPEDTFSVYADEAPEVWGRQTCHDIADYLSQAVDRLDDIVNVIERAREQ